MSTYATIAAKIDRGYSRAASKLGAPFLLIRPTDPMAPMQGVVGPIAATMTQAANYKRSGLFGKETDWTGFFDLSQTQPGDYLTGPDGTWFVAQQTRYAPPLLVQCNCVVSIAAPDEAGTPGFGTAPLAPGQAAPYDAVTEAGEVILAAGWFAQKEQGTKGERGDAGLPDDTRAPWWNVALPGSLRVPLSYDTILTEADGTRHTVSSAERTNEGWRLRVGQAVS